ncbi:MAG: CRISPR-associated protein Cas4 [Euryarchaeota archaeon]|nr:CRISPR-associated protein Cas4 [Euryarchaeota archaeon]
MIETEDRSDEAETGPENIYAGIQSGAVRITGVKVNYYHICHTKLWLFSHNITLESEHENVEIGRQLHEDRYKRDTKDVTIDNAISIDFVRRGSRIELHEVKKTKKMEDAHRAQILFYLYYLKQRGVEAEGVINYPLINKTEQVILTPDDEAVLQNDIEEIERIVQGDMPHPKRRRICAKCAYLEFCFCDEVQAVND